MTRVPFDVPITNDDVLESNEDFTLTINSSSLPDGVTRGNPGSTTVNIRNDDGEYAQYCIYYASVVV